MSWESFEGCLDAVGKQMSFKCHYFNPKAHVQGLTCSEGCGSQEQGWESNLHLGWEGRLSVGLVCVLDRYSGVTEEVISFMREKCVTSCTHSMFKSVNIRGSYCSYTIISMHRCSLNTLSLDLGQCTGDTRSWPLLTLGSCMCCWHVDDK